MFGWNLKNLIKNKKKIILILCGIWLILIAIWTNPKQKSVGSIRILDRNNLQLYEKSGQFGFQEYVGIDHIPITFQQTVVLIEDKNYWSHCGIDLGSIFRAMGQNIKAKKIVSGASTIPQQVARFTIISPYKIPKIGILRKTREMLIALRISLVFSKDQILEQYLNSMYFGRQTYGVQSASKKYFGKDVSSISHSEMALLAGMISNPSNFDPIAQPDTAIERRNSTLSKMLDKSIISQEEFDRSINEPLPESVHQFDFIAPHFVQMVLNELSEILPDNKKSVVITTSLDSNWYKKIRQIAQRHIENLKDEHQLNNSAIVIIDNEKSELLSLMGSIDYFDSSIDGQSNMAIALRQPGSAMKPVTYASAFEKGIATTATAIDDLEKVFITGNGDGFIPRNYSGRYHGVVLAREALASSYNLPAVEMLNRVGINSFLELAHRMGISSMNDTDRYDLALTLGGGEVSLLELTNLYATFAKGGVYDQIKLINKIEINGEEIYVRPELERKRVLDEDVAWLITDILKDQKARMPTFGEKSSLLLTKPAAVKTGTTTDWHDNWTIGYTKDFTVGVWVGNANNQPMRDITGVTGAGPIWHDIFEELLKFEEYSKFVSPPNISQVKVCAWDGLLPTDFCEERYEESFIQGTEPSIYTQLTTRPAGNQSVTNQTIMIVSPRHGAKYEIGALEEEEIIFELSYGSSAKKDEINWFLDDKRLDCNQICGWKPTLGKHKLYAEINSESGKIKTSEAVFEVIGYKEGW